MVLTNAEFDSLHDKALCSFGDVTKMEVNNAIFGRRPCGKLRHKAELLWLCVYALESWDNTPGAFNYITESQMLKILDKVQKHGV